MNALPVIRNQEDLDKLTPGQKQLLMEYLSTDYAMYRISKSIVIGCSLVVAVTLMVGTLVGKDGAFAIEGYESAFNTFTTVCLCVMAGLGLGAYLLARKTVIEYREKVIASGVDAELLKQVAKDSAKFIKSRKLNRFGHSFEDIEK